MRLGKKVARIGLVIGAFTLLTPAVSTTASFQPVPGEYSTGVQWTHIPPLGHPQAENSWSVLAKAPFRSQDRFNSGDTICVSVNDPRCATNGRSVTPEMLNGWNREGTFGYSWIAVFPQCQSTDQLNCVVNLTARRNDTNLTSRYSRNFPSGTPFTGESSLKIPDGGYAPVYSIDGLPAASDSSEVETQEFVVRVTAYGKNRIASCIAKADAASPWCLYKKGQINDINQDFGLYPESRIEGFRVDILRARNNADLNNPVEYVELNIEKDVRFTVTTRVADYVTPRGWLHGRLDAPTFTQTPISGGYELTIGGSATQTPNPDGKLTCADYSRLTTPETALAKTDFEDAWSRRLQQAGVPSAPVCDATAIQRLVAASSANFMHYYSSYIHRSLTPRTSLTNRNDPDLQREISWIIALGDKANSVSSQWMVEWVPPDKPGAEWNASPCNTNGLAGIVSTNAAMYGELPIFNPQTGALEYAMAGPHYLEDGVTLNRGSYSLIVAREYALCAWGLDPANTEMAVTVGYDSGVQQEPPAVTTSFDDRFFTLTASGFTFSAPKVAVKPQEKKIKAKRTVRAKARSKVNVSKVLPVKRNRIVSWYLQSGKCTINNATPEILRMPRKGKCKLVVTQFNTKTKKGTRTLVTLRP